LARLDDYGKISQTIKKGGSMGNIRFKDIGNYKCASFSKNTKHNLLRVSYGGNMGTPMEEVERCAIEFLGYNPFLYEKISEEGSPDYSYKVVFNLDKEYIKEGFWQNLFSDIDTCSKKDVAYIYGKGIRRKFDKIKDAIEDHDLKLALHLIKNYKEEY
jgi:hypothetical protein